MITIQAALDEKGILRQFSVTGHAGAGPHGEDIVCAAVSVLTRTAVRFLADKQGIETRAAAPERGELRFEADYNTAGESLLAAAGAFLLEGLQSVAEDYPDNCRVSIVDWRKEYGT
jgi:uncharacterized protein YsxB (DUF464 family)